MEISVKLFVYCFIIGILHCPNYARANDEDLENFLLSLDQCLLQIDEYNEEPGRRLPGIRSQSEPNTQSLHRNKVRAVDVDILFHWSVLKFFAVQACHGQRLQIALESVPKLFKEEERNTTCLTRTVMSVAKYSKLTFVIFYA